MKPQSSEKEAEAEQNLKRERTKSVKPLVLLMNET